MITELETERLLLRPFRNEDFEPLAEMMTNEEHMKFIGGTCDRETAWRRLATSVGHWHLRGFGFFALEEKTSGNFLGWTGLWFPQGWPEKEIGWTLLPQACGKGFVTEAAKRVRQHAYQDLGWKTAISLIARGNEASKKVAERLGATFERDINLWDMDCMIYRHLSPSELKTET
ncbi:Acetyltransferase, GNAT family [hydrothermal vent metagenome]|uniref:Acetyltransferase, GNAT family n=1 Tax=hydrothermal vent metagenome TaxID=652676 RepID=A0A3B0S9L1_9ZZZZ